MLLSVPRLPAPPFLPSGSALLAQRPLCFQGRERKVGRNPKEHASTGGQPDQPLLAITSSRSSSPPGPVRSGSLGQGEAAGAGSSGGKPKLSRQKKQIVTNTTTRHLPLHHITRGPAAPRHPRCRPSDAQLGGRGFASVQARGPAKKYQQSETPNAHDNTHPHAPAGPQPRPTKDRMRAPLQCLSRQHAEAPENARARVPHASQNKKVKGVRFGVLDLVRLPTRESSRIRPR